MAGFSIFKSTPPTITPPNIKLDNAAPSERLEQVQSLLMKGGGKSRLFATKINGETILYVARDATDGRQLPHDQGFRNVAARAELARKELGNILRACVRAKIVDGTAPGANPKLNEMRAEMRGLLTNAIDRTTRTTEVPTTAGFAPPGQGQGRTGSFFSLPSLTWMRSFGRSWIAPLTAPKAYVLNDVIAEFARRFERIDAAEKRAGLPAPSFPPTANVDAMLTTTLDGIAEPFPILEVGGKTFEPIQRLGAGSYGQVLRYRCEETGETKIVKLARQRPDDPTKTPEHNKFVRDYYLKRHREDSAFELNAGQKYAAGKPNVLGFTEHVILSNHTVALIGDDGGGSDITKFGFKMNQQLHAGRIGLHERRLIALTLTRDVTQGVASLKAGGAVHGDMKPDNQVIDANGVAHLIDLGFTEAGPVTMHGRLMTNASYNAPEVQRLHQDKNLEEDHPQKISIKALQSNVKGLHMALEHLVSTKKKARAFWIGAETTPVFVQAARVLGEGAFGIDSRADVFGAGITMTALMTGMFPSDLRAKQRLLETENVENFESVEQRQEMHDAVAKTKVDAAVHPTMKGVSYAGGSANGYIEPVGDATADALLNDMLTPNRENRMEAEQVLEHPSMSYAAHDGVRAVGSPEVRNLIKAIAGGRADEIAAAAAALRMAHPDPDPDSTAALPVMPVSTEPSWYSDVSPLQPLTGQPFMTPLEPLLVSIPVEPTLSSDGWSPPPPPPLSYGGSPPPPPPPLSSSEWSPPPPPPLSSGEWSPSNATPLRSSQIPPAPPLSGDPGYFETGSDASTPPPLPPRPPADLDPDGKVRFDP